VPCRTSRHMRRCSQCAACQPAAVNTSNILKRPKPRAVNPREVTVGPKVQEGSVGRRK
jgi:hypothetical protein